MATDYSAFDKPEILLFLFHPRKEGNSSLPSNAKELLIPVSDNNIIGGRIYTTHESAPNILFFHGNGEIVDDYGDLAPLYNELGINFIPVDYRGYGKSTGDPSVSSMLKDSHDIYKYIKKWLGDNNYTGRFIIQGRSLGSACALELASNYHDEIDGIIIESGFAYAVPLLKLLGVNTDTLAIKEEEGFNNLNKMKTFRKPTLVIHAEFDHIIPFSDGEALYNSSPAEHKKFLKIPKANHNTIFYHGLQEYMSAIKIFTDHVNEN